MIKTIEKIKNLGIFSEYKHDSALPDFKRYNLFYGWNGSGKTTLTKLFSSLDDGASKEFAELEYEIDSESGTFKNGDKFDKKIMVFNKDYIEENIEISGSRAKPIFILGSENKAMAEKVEKDEILLSDLRKKLKEQNDDKVRKEKERGNKFTDVAKIIGANTSGSSIRNYRKPEAESAFKLLSSKAILNIDEVSDCSITLKQEEKPKVSPINLSVCLSDFNEIIKRGRELCQRIVSSSAIQRLKDNPDISSWVEIGLGLHNKHDSKNCEFCGQALHHERMKDLAKYFNEEDRMLKEEISSELKKLELIYNNIASYPAPDKANLYQELQAEYVSRVTTFNKERINFLEKVSEFSKILESKKSKVVEEVKFSFDLPDNFEKSIENVNNVLKKHNEKTSNFQDKRDDAQKRLERHYLSEIFDEVKTIEKEISDCEEEIKKINDGDGDEPGIRRLVEQIAANKATISSEHKACDILNSKLETFLGRKEIIFEVSPGGGYVIKRDGKIAINLSEGEKTAIAFVYFIVHLNNQNFNLTDGIVVIDDPISSLDSNSLFQAFSFLKNSVEDAKQVFILTHNFDFLRLLINWLNHSHSDKKTYLMICNKFENERVAYIGKLDPLLEKYESEYHYLCKILLTLECDGTIASVYNIPNIARKVLDSFLMFRVPSGDNAFEKLKALTFDEDKKTAIYKFVNDQSHITGKGFDPCLIPETQKNVQYLLEMMDSTFPEHFQILKSSIPL
jgi:wobble nucleotide-excising tRNase